MKSRRQWLLNDEAELDRERQQDHIENKILEKNNSRPRSGNERER